MIIRLTGTTIILIALLLPAAAGAFDDRDSTVARNWGKSYHMFKQAQIANPDAGAVTGPVEGLEGRAANNTMDAFYDSFSKEQVSEGYSFKDLTDFVGEMD